MINEIEQIDAVLAGDGSRHVTLYGWTREDTVWLASLDLPEDMTLRDLELRAWDVRFEIPWHFPSQWAGSLLADAMQTRH
jgi:hypothetical protein